MKRDDVWLQQVLDKIWDNYFNDVVQDNDVRIVFGRRAKRRLGSISLDSRDGRTSVITINSIFKRVDVPEYVIEGTIAHELIHYAHGFNSPLDRSQKHPHAGGVMRREFAERGLLELYLLQKQWLKDNWYAIASQELGAASSRQVHTAGNVKIPKPFWYMGD